MIRDRELLLLPSIRYYQIPFWLAYSLSRLARYNGKVKMSCIYDGDYLAMRTDRANVTTAVDVASISCEMLLFSHADLWTHFHFL